MFNRLSLPVLILVVGLLPRGLAAAGTLTVSNTTSGMLKVLVSRGNNKNYFTHTIAFASTFVKGDLLETGDVIEFEIFDTSGPTLPVHTVGSAYGRPANVIVNCKSDQCTISEK